MVKNSMHEGEFAKFWDWYHSQNRARNVPINQLLEPYFKKNIITPGGRILEIGCGNGRNLSALQHLFSEVCGCDISKVAINHALKNNERQIFIKKCDLQTVPFEKKHFEVVLMVKTLGTVGNERYLLNLVKRAKSALKFSGTLVVIDFILSKVSKTTSYSIELDDTRICSVQPSWSPTPFLHFTRANIHSLFRPMKIVHFLKTDLESYRGNNYPGFISILKN